MRSSRKGRHWTRSAWVSEFVGRLLLFFSATMISTKYAAIYNTSWLFVILRPCRKKTVWCFLRRSKQHGSSSGGVCSCRVGVCCSLADDETTSRYNSTFSTMPCMHYSRSVTLFIAITVQPVCCVLAVSSLFCRFW